MIEIDGGQHAVQAEEDAARSEALARRGYRVLRFWNNEVLENLPGVIETIRAALEEAPVPPVARGPGGAEGA